MKILIISPKNRTVYNFRGDLIKTIVAMGHTVVVTGPDTVDVEKITALGAEFVEVSVSKNSINIFKDIKYKKELKKLIQSIKPDLVFTYTVKPIVYGGLAAKECGVKKIYPMITGKGYVFNSDEIKAKLLKWGVCKLYKMGLRGASKVIFQNRDDLELFCNLRLAEKEKCFVVNGSGVNMEQFSKAPLPKNPSFFMLSRMMYCKGIREYLKAAEMVKQKYPNVSFSLLGNIENIQNSVSKGEIAYYVNKGVITHYGECEDVVPYYHACSVFVLPSYSEGTPRAVLEAMSCGRAIITTDAPGCKETVKDGVNGFIVPVKSSEAVAGKMIELIENPLLVQKMGEASYKYCKEKFEVSKVNARMLEIMEITPDKNVD